MAFHIRNPETDALARKVAAVKGVGLAEAVHEALQHELERAGETPSIAGEKLSIVERGLRFAEELRRRSHPERGLPADKAFIDSLYEDD